MFDKRKFSVVGLAIALAACSESNRTQSNDNAGAAGTTVAVGENASSELNAQAANGMAATAQSAETFVQTIAGSDQYEIQSGRLAQDKASNAALKDFGRMLVTDHQKSTADLKTAAASASPAITPPTNLPAEHQAKIDALRAASGAGFDRLFLQQQKEGHQKALETLNGYSSGGDQQSLKTFAATAAPVVQRHLDELNKMKL